MNRAAVEQYLDRIWLPAVRIVESLAPANGIPGHVAARFESYVLAEEHRLQENLQGIGYNIDAPETVNMTIGPGSIEKVCTNPDENSLQWTDTAVTRMYCLSCVCS